ncbi:MAG: LysE family transporter [candidate division Zixibacteria bacterium]|nr:LysE family transporter [candidate division Zixibacteria bacterium]
MNTFSWRKGVLRPYIIAMTLVELFFMAFGVGLSGALMPGPLLTVDIAESTRRGFWTGPILVGGHAIAELVVVVALAIGLSELLASKSAFTVIGLVGGAALVAMGGMMFYDIIRGRLSFDPNQPGAKSGLLIGKGITTSLTNPYWIVWWATIGSAFLTKSLAHGPAGPVVFYVGHISSDLVWYTFVSFMIAIGKKLLVGKPYYILISLCALFLVYLGVKFIIDAV